MISGVSFLAVVAKAAIPIVNRDAYYFKSVINSQVLIIINYINGTISHPRRLDIMSKESGHLRNQYHPHLQRPQNVPHHLRGSSLNTHLRHNSGLADLTVP